MELLKKLLYTERIKFYKTVKETEEPNGSLAEYLTEQRFSGGRVCLQMIKLSVKRANVAERESHKRSFEREGYRSPKQSVECSI